MKGKPTPHKRQIAACPFCGGDGVLTARRYGTTTRHFVICANMKCGAGLIDRNTPTQAVEQWNRRVINLRLVQPSNNNQQQLNS